jgi:hypothetical protein
MGSGGGFAGVRIVSSATPARTSVSDGVPWTSDSRSVRALFLAGTSLMADSGEVGSGCGRLRGEGSVTTTLGVLAGGEGCIGIGYMSVRAPRVYQE